MKLLRLICQMNILASSAKAAQKKKIINLPNNSVVKLKYWGKPKKNLPVLVKRNINNKNNNINKINLKIILIV